MRARCGRCGTGFEVIRPGRYPCPACGVTNEVRAGAPHGPGAGPPAGAHGGIQQGPIAPPPERPSRRARCPRKECGFSFIVGAIAAAPCPMCGVEVKTGIRKGRKGGSS